MYELADDQNAAVMYSTIPMQQDDDADERDTMEWMHARVTPFGRVRPMRGTIL